MAGESSCSDNRVKNDDPSIAIMPRLTAAPLRTSTAANADNTDESVAKTAATGHGETCIKPNALMSRRKRACVVCATCTADLFYAVFLLKNMSTPPYKIRGVHLGAVAAILCICQCTREVIVAAFAAVEATNPHNLRAYLDLVLPPRAHDECSGKLVLTGTDIQSSEITATRIWNSRSALINNVCACVDIPHLSWLDRLWNTSVPVDPTWPVTTAWTCQTLNRKDIYLNITRASHPVAFSAKGLSHTVVWDLVCGSDPVRLLSVEEGVTKS